MCSQSFVTIYLILIIGLLWSKFSDLYGKNQEHRGLQENMFPADATFKWVASASPGDKYWSCRWYFFPTVRAVQGQRVTLYCMDHWHSWGKFRLCSDFEALGCFAIIRGIQDGEGYWHLLQELFCWYSEMLQNQVF